MGSVNDDKNTDGLSDLELPSVEVVFGLIASLLRQRRQMAFDDLVHQVVGQMESIGDEALLENSVSIIIDKLVEMDFALMMIHPDILVTPSSLFNRAVLTHRITEEEVDNSLVHIAGDLLPFTWFSLPIYLVSGEELKRFEIDNGEEIWEGPPDWLDRFEPGSMLAFSLDCDSGLLSIEPVNGLFELDRELIEQLREAYDIEVEGSGLPVRADEMATRVILESPLTFAKPVLPLTELLDAAGLESRGSEYAHDESVWVAREILGAALEISEQLDDSNLRMQAMKVLTCFWNGERNHGKLREALASLRIPAIASTIGNVLVGDETDSLCLDEIDGFLAALLMVGSNTYDCAAVHWLAALVAENRRDLVTAQARLERAVESDPNWPLGLDRLAWYLSDRGDANRAVKLWQRLAEYQDVDVDLREVGKFATGEGPSLGRNEPCWCGSGRKFKQCHLGRPTLAPLVDRVSWLYRKGVAYLEHNAQDSMQQSYELALIRAGGDSSESAIDKAFEDPLLVDVMFSEEGWFESFVDERGPLLPDDEALLARAWCYTQRTLFEIEEVHIGEGLIVRDLRSAEVIEVRERAFSYQAQKGIVICARALPDGVSHQFFGGMFYVTPGYEGQLLDLLDEGDGEGILEWVSASEKPPTVQNRESESLVFCKAVVEGDDIGQMREALDEMFIIEDKDKWRQVFELANGESVLRASICLVGKSIQIDTNSVERMDRVLEMLENKVSGYRLVSNERKEFDFADLPQGDRPKQERIDDPKLREYMKKFIAEQELKWCDEEIPALGGITPRQAAQDPTRRESLDRLLLSYERDSDEEDEELIMQYPPRLRKLLGIG